MEAMESAFSGPLMYLLIVWGVVTAVFLLLIAWRSVLSSHEDDQIFIDAAEQHHYREQLAIIARISRLTKPIIALAVLSGALLLVSVGVWIYQGFLSF